MRQSARPVHGCVSSGSRETLESVGRRTPQRSPVARTNARRASTEAKHTQYCSIGLCSARKRLVVRNRSPATRLPALMTVGTAPVLTGWTCAGRSTVLSDMRTRTTANHFGTSACDVERRSADVPQIHDGALVVVQGDWRDWRTAMVRLTDLENIHWSQPSGAPRPLIHATVCCETIVSGAIAHECLAPCSHSLVVCVLRCHTSPWVFEELARRAGEVDSAAHTAHPLSPGGERLAGVDWASRSRLQT